MTYYTYYYHAWIYLGSCWYCEKCGAQSDTTAPPQSGCSIREARAALRGER